MFLCFVLVGLIFNTLPISEKPIQAATGNDAFVLELEGPISPGTATYVTRGIEKAHEQGASLIVLRLDTPGGLASSMRTMTKT